MRSPHRSCERPSSPGARAAARSTRPCSAPCSGRLRPTFGELDAHVDAGERAPAAPSSALQLVACTDIEVDDNTVVLPAGTGFDPGGIGKGLAADLVVASRWLGRLARRLRERRRRPAGRAASVRPAAGGRSRSTARTRRSGTIVDVGLDAGAVATSTTARRRWRIDGDDRHHLIDPATGSPSTTDLVQASAVTGRCWLAETYAKTILLRGSGRAFDLLPTAIGALAVAADGRVIEHAVAETAPRRPPAPARIERPTEVHDRGSCGGTSPAPPGSSAGPARGQRRVGTRPLHQDPPAAGPAELDPRPAPLPRRAGDDLHRRPRHRHRRRQLHPLRPDRHPGPVRLVVAARRRGLGRRVDVPPGRRRAHLARPPPLPGRAWRTIHLASFPLFATSTVHALTAGTDTANPVFRIAVWTVSVVVVALTARRLHQQVATTTAPRPHDVRPVHPSPGLRSSTPPTAPPMRSVPGPPVPPARSTPVLTGPPARPRGSPRAGAARSRAGVGTTTTGPRT